MLVFVEVSIGNSIPGEANAGKEEVPREHFEAVHRRDGERLTSVMGGVGSAPMEKVDVLLALETFGDGRPLDQTVYHQPF